MASQTPLTSILGSLGIIIAGTEEKRCHLRAEALARQDCEAQASLFPGSEGPARALAPDLPFQIPVPIGPLPDLYSGLVCL